MGGGAEIEDMTFGGWAVDSEPGVSAGVVSSSEVSHAQPPRRF